MSNEAFNWDSFDWDSIYHGDTRDHQPPDAQVLALASALPPARVLDVGCGAGGLVLALAQRGWKCSGIDLSPKAIRSANARLEAAGESADLRAADACDWRPHGEWDLVTNTFALPIRAADQARAYRTIRDAVAPGGRVILKDFDTQMSRFSEFDGCDLIALDVLVAAFDGFVIERAEIVQTPAHHPNAADAEPWSACLLVARRPAQ